MILMEIATSMATENVNCVLLDFILVETANKSLTSRNPDLQVLLGRNENHQSRIDTYALPNCLLFLRIVCILIIDTRLGCAHIVSRIEARIYITIKVVQ